MADERTTCAHNESRPDSLADWASFARAALRTSLCTVQALRRLDELAASRPDSFIASAAQRSLAHSRLRRSSQALSASVGRDERHLADRKFNPQFLEPDRAPAPPSSWAGHDEAGIYGVSVLARCVSAASLRRQPHLAARWPSEELLLWRISMVSIGRRQGDRHARPTVGGLRHEVSSFDSACLNELTLAPCRTFRYVLDAVRLPIWGWVEARNARASNSHPRRRVRRSARARAMKSHSLAGRPAAGSKRPPTLVLTRG